jgi:hypothetical protein
MMGKLLLASAVVAAVATPGLAADSEYRGEGPPVYVEPQARVYTPGAVYAPADVVTGPVIVAPRPAGVIAPAPVAPRRYVYPADADDSYAWDEGPVVRTEERVIVAPAEPRPGYRDVYMTAPAGPGCEPGTVVRMQDGRRYVCQ